MRLRRRNAGQSDDHPEVEQSEVEPVGTPAALTLNV